MQLGGRFDIVDTRQLTKSKCHQCQRNLYSVVQDGVEVASGLTEGGIFFALHRAVESVQNIRSANKSWNLELHTRE